jgi:hypothetical protein
MHKCFSRYPRFLLSELVGTTKSPLTNNSTTTFVKWDRRQRDNNRGRGRGTKPKGNQQPQRSHSAPHNRDNRNREQGNKQKGKGKPDRNSQGNRSKKRPCNYCSKEGHEARECRKQIYDEKQKSKAPQTNNAQHLTIDETAIMFTQNVVFAIASDSENMFNVSDTNLEIFSTCQIPTWKVTTQQTYLYSDSSLRLMKPCSCRSKICDAPESTIIVIDPGISSLHIASVSSNRLIVSAR